MNNEASSFGVGKDLSKNGKVWRQGSSKAISIQYDERLWAQADKGKEVQDLHNKKEREKTAISLHHL
jgi:hypothetical protein